MADPNQLTAAEAVKFFAKQTIKVSMPKTGKGGALVRDPGTGRCVVEDVPLTPELVAGVRESANEVFITTADGKKYQAPKADKAAK